MLTKSRCVSPQAFELATGDYLFEPHSGEDYSRDEGNYSFTARDSTHTFHRPAETQNANPSHILGVSYHLNESH